MKNGGMTRLAPRMIGMSDASRLNRPDSSKEVRISQPDFSIL